MKRDRNETTASSPIATVPTWFSNAIAVPFTEHVAAAGEQRVHYLRWGKTAKPALILIHGGGAHAYWWAYLAPLLTGAFDVIAVDLTGHGDSSRRERYVREVWAEDIVAVLGDARLSSRVYLAGHSMGGFASIVTAALHGDRLAGAIVVDSPIVEPTHTPAAPAEPRAGGQRFWRIDPYPDFATAVSRFRLLPEQPGALPFLLEFVAARSVREDADGFTWKFDPRVFEKASTSSLIDSWKAATCRLALIRGERSVVLSRATADAMIALRPGVPFVEIPEAHHHLMFDQPLALAVALRAILATWEADEEAHREFHA